MASAVIKATNAAEVKLSSCSRHCHGLGPPMLLPPPLVPGRAANASAKRASMKRAV